MSTVRTGTLRMKGGVILRDFITGCLDTIANASVLYVDFDDTAVYTVSVCEGRLALMHASRDIFTALAGFFDLWDEVTNFGDSTHGHHIIK